jgi:hypothetical protein
MKSGHASFGDHSAAYLLMTVFEVLVCWVRAKK